MSDNVLTKPPNRLRRVFIGVAAITLLVIALGASLRYYAYAIQRDDCRAMLRTMGLLIQMYAHENHGTLPPSMGAIMATEEITPDAFICGASTSETPASASTPPELARQIDDPSMLHCSYRYAGNGLVDNGHLDPKAVLVFELPVNHGGIFHVVFGNGDVGRLTAVSPGSGAADGDHVDFEKLLADFQAGVRPLRLPPHP